MQRLGKQRYFESSPVLLFPQLPHNPVADDCRDTVLLKRVTPSLTLQDIDCEIAYCAQTVTAHDNCHTLPLIVVHHEQQCDADRHFSKSEQVPHWVGFLDFRLFVQSHHVRRGRCVGKAGECDADKNRWEQVGNEEVDWWDALEGVHGGRISFLLKRRSVDKYSVVEDCATVSISL